MAKRLLTEHKTRNIPEAMSLQMSARPKESVTLPQLTTKQREVLALVADNRTSKEIAARLGISESAVNQRIEMVRARLGGLPRGELARLYRQEYLEPEITTEIPTWQKIHLPRNGFDGHGNTTEGIPALVAGASQTGQAGNGNGSQLSAFLLGSTPTWLSRDTRATALVRATIMSALILSGMAIAAFITQLLTDSLGV